VRRDTSKKRVAIDGRRQTLGRGALRSGSSRTTVFDHGVFSAEGGDEGNRKKREEKRRQKERERDRKSTVVATKHSTL
jgi:hypothetical protein